MAGKRRQRSTHQGGGKRVPTIAAALASGALVELVYDAAAGTTALAVGQEGSWRLVDHLAGEAGEYLVPYSAQNTLIRNGVILFPSEPQDYGSETELLAAVRAFIHRYVDVSPGFLRIASHYVLLSWLYDDFNALPYLRLRGDYGSGKTRFLLTVGALCYRPIFTSGASTVSPIFHILDRFGGTLVVDEADLRFSDEKADMVKILNNGNVRGLPVLRSEVSPEGEVNPRAFRVFGPKIVATRGDFADRALESRFLTEETGAAPLRPEVPINLPERYRDEARALRNKLLAYRFRNHGARGASESLVDPALEPRLNQIFVPLLGIADEEKERDALRSIARAYQRERLAERGLQIEAQLLTVIRRLAMRSRRPGVAIRDIVALFAHSYGRDASHPPSHKWVGSLLRRRLNLKTGKSHGNYVIPITEQAKLERLYARYGVSEADAAALDAEPGPDEAQLRRLVEEGDIGEEARQ